MWRLAGGLLFLGGLGCAAKARSWSWENERLDWREAQLRGDTDLRWGIVALLLLAVGMVLLG